MLKNKSKIIAIFITLILLFSTTAVFAENEVAENTPVENTQTEGISEENQTAEDIQSAAKTDENNYKKSDVYLTGDDVTIDYIIDGNLFVCAKNVTLNSQIGGDAIIIAENLTINKEAYIFSNLFTTSKCIDIKGVVYDVYACAETINLTGGYIYRDIKAFCNTLNVNGSVGRNAFIDCAHMNFNTEENSKGTIYGNLNYTSNSEISIPDGAVSGETKFTKSTTYSEEKSTSDIIAQYLLNLGTFLAFVLIIWLICLWLTPKFLESTNNYVGKKTLSVLGIGLIALIIIPICCILLFILRLTSTFGLLLMALYIISIALSMSVFTITANRFLCTKLKINKNIGIFGMLIVSGTIIWVLTKIPYAGPIISFIITVLGLGIIISYILPKKEKKIETPKTKKISKTEEE